MRRCRKDVHHRQTYPREFCEDLIQVARTREPDVRLKDIVSFDVLEALAQGR